MANRQRYRKKPNQYVVAVQLKLDTEGFRYHKWKAEQFCKQGDWLVDNNGEVYTVDQAVFKRTYREIERGHYLKTTPVWAEIATEAGSVATKEGESHYEAGDYLVYNNEDGSDPYCTRADRFESMYEPADD